MKAALARRDDTVEADEFDVYLDTFHDHLSGFRFRVTPGGATNFTDLKEFARPGTYDFAVYGRDKGVATRTTSGDRDRPRRWWGNV